MPERAKAHHVDIEQLAHRLDTMCAHGEGVGIVYPFVVEASVALRSLSNQLYAAEERLADTASENMMLPKGVSQDERDAVQLVSRLVRASRKWDADDRIKARAEQAADWLERYNKKHPSRIFRGSSENEADGCD